MDIGEFPHRGGREIYKGPTRTLENGNNKQLVRKRRMAMWAPEVLSGLENSVLSLRGTGWWLKASRAAGALAKKAEVQGSAPAGTGACLNMGQEARQKPRRGAMRTSTKVTERREGLTGGKGVQSEAVVLLRRFRLGSE